MVIRKLLGVLAGMLLSLTAFAQEIKGTVKDSTGKVVPWASVNLIMKAANTVIAYTTTDVTGGYILKLPANTMLDSVNIEVRCIGFKTQVKEITGKSARVDFVLAVSVNELQSVIVQNKNNQPVLRTNGDTLKYKVSDFSSVHDRVIADVIKRLPGMSVAEDGTISYNNKIVSGVYLGGDNLLDDKYNIATNSIPQGVVDQVQVIDNHQPIKVLQNKVASNAVALNLTFKNSAKLKLFGQEIVGVGLPDNYNAELNTMLFNDKYKGINYLKGNNTGDDLQRDVSSHNSDDYQRRTGFIPSAAMLSLGQVNNPEFARTRYFMGSAGILNTNNLVNFKSGLQLRINAYYLYNKQQQGYSQHTAIFFPGNTVQYTETQQNRYNPSFLHARVTFNINKEKYYLNNILLVDDKRWVNHSDLNTNGVLINQVLHDAPTSFSNEFNTIQTTRRNSVIEAYSFISRQSAPESRTIGQNYNAELFNHGVPYQQLVQYVNVPTWVTNNYLSFKIPGSWLTQSFKTGFSVQSQRLASNLSILQTNNTATLLQDSAANHLSWNNKKLYAEAAYDIPGKKLKANLTLPVTLQHLTYSDTGYLLNKNITRMYFNPQLYAKYQTGKEHFITLMYSYNSETGTVEDMYQGYILKDYHTLYANNADLTLLQNQSAAAGFTYRKAIKLLFFNVNVAYNHVHANNIASSIITNSLQQRVIMPYPNNIDSWIITGSTSKYSFKVHTTFSVALQWQQNRSLQIQNRKLQPFNTSDKTLVLGAETKLNDKLNFSYRITELLISSRLQANGQANNINQVKQRATIYYDVFRCMQLKLSGEHSFTHRRGYIGLTYLFADASMKYRIEKWNIDMQLEANNILNVKTYKAIYLAGNTFTNSSYILPGRIVLLKVLFNL